MELKYVVGEGVVSKRKRNSYCGIGGKLWRMGKGNYSVCQMAIRVMWLRLTLSNRWCPPS